MPKKKAIKDSLYPLIPIRDLVIFPGMIIPLLIGREKTLKTVKAAIDEESLLIVSSQKKTEIEFPKAKDLYRVGVICKILKVMELPNNTIKILVEGLERVKIVKIINEDGKFKADINIFPMQTYENKVEEKAILRNTLEKIKEYIELNPKLPEGLIDKFNNLETIKDLICTATPYFSISFDKKQDILSKELINDQLRAFTEIVITEIELLKLSKKIEEQVRDQVKKSQKEYFLNEQLKAIKKELGQDYENEENIEELHKKLKSLNLKEEIHLKIESEINRLKHISYNSPESGVIRSYLDWIFSLPWNNKTEEVNDFSQVVNILNSEHYGLEKVKERILEFLAVLKLKKKIQGQILCLVGPPGVGKTSLGKSIAHALNRKFARISLGGVRDEAEIRGHRRTYIGAIPGRIIQALKQVNSRNPVFLLDEIDKLSKDYHGDPEAALLEVLDSEQNNTFQDHYLDVPFDLSEVLFITTANVKHTISQPLLDRMEIIEIPGYLEHEKFGIAKSFLVKKQIENAGLNYDIIDFDDNAILKIIRNYTNESGVRQLDREIGNITRKIAKKWIQNEIKDKVIIDENLVESLLGAPKYINKNKLKEDSIGIATGLAWTRFGGDVLYIQTLIMPGKGELLLTGQLGDVMKESARAAYSYARANAIDLGIEQDFYSKYDIHIHVPEGAIPKDGPSAGITLASSLISALSKIPIKKDFAMTGEITLTGEVLPIGGLPEKTMAALQIGIKNIILPEDNRKDYNELPKEIKEKLEVYFVRNIKDVLNLVLCKK